MQIMTKITVNMGNNIRKSYSFLITLTVYWRISQPDHSNKKDHWDSGLQTFNTVMQHVFISNSKRAWILSVSEFRLHLHVRQHL